MIRCSLTLEFNSDEISSAIYPRPESRVVHSVRRGAVSAQLSAVIFLKLRHLQLPAKRWQYPAATDRNSQ